MRMKNIMVVSAVLVLLVACAPQAPQVMPAAQPVPVVQQPPAASEPIEKPPASQPEVQVEQQTAPAMRTVDVQIKGFKFVPAVITVNKGDAVRWTNYDSAAHTATGAFDTGNLAKGQTGEITFDTEGIYDYTCSFHPNMKGQVVVQ